MRYVAGIVMLAMLAGGCDGSRSAEPVLVQPANERQAVLPAAPILTRLAGKWGQLGHEVVRITIQANKTGLLEIAEPGPGWRAEVRRARIESGRIMYEQYHYAQDVPDHPVDGARCDVVIEPIGGLRDRVKLTVTLEGQEPATKFLDRME